MVRGISYPIILVTDRPSSLIPLRALLEPPHTPRTPRTPSYLSYPSYPLVPLVPLAPPRTPRTPSYPSHPLVPLVPPRTSLIYHGQFTPRSQQGEAEGYSISPTLEGYSISPTFYNRVKQKGSQGNFDRAQHSMPLYIRSPGYRGAGGKGYRGAGGKGYRGAGGKGYRGTGGKGLDRNGIEV